MAGSSILDFRVLVIPGLHGSGPAHWQSRWESRYPYFERVEQRRWDVPDVPVWSAQVRCALLKSELPALLVAHSFGCLAAARCIARYPGRVAGALLVAPADPDKFKVSHLLPRAPLGIPSVLMASTDDPWMAIETAQQWADVWGADFVNLGKLGHVNAESRLGEWPHGFRRLQDLASTIPTPGYFKTRCSSRPILNLGAFSV